MKNALYLKKLGMSQLISEDGKVQSVTIFEKIESEILEVRSKEKNNYDAIVVGFSKLNPKRITKSTSGYFNKLNKSSYKYIKEIKFNLDVSLLNEDNSSFNESLIDLNSFNEKDTVNFKGKSKGKGFQGTIKAHGFARGPMSHGSKNHRLPGSIGAGTDPARVFKGTKMGKRCGNKNVTIQNLEILKIDNEKKLVFVKGAVPGNKNQVLLMYK